MSDYDEERAPPKREGSALDRAWAPKARRAPAPAKTAPSDIELPIETWGTMAGKTRVLVGTGDHKVTAGMSAIVFGVDDSNYTLDMVVPGHAVGMIDTDMLDLSSATRVIVNPSDAMVKRSHAQATRRDPRKR